MAAQREKKVREEVKQLVERLRETLSQRDGSAFRVALEHCYANEAVSMEDVEQALSSLIEADPDGVQQFWQDNHPDSFEYQKRDGAQDYLDPGTNDKFRQSQHFDRRYIYFLFRIGGMGYGPGFRLLRDVYRKGD